MPYIEYPRGSQPDYREIEADRWIENLCPRCGSGEVENGVVCLFGDPYNNAGRHCKDCGFHTEDFIWIGVIEDRPYIAPGAPGSHDTPFDRGLEVFEICDCAECRAIRDQP